MSSIFATIFSRKKRVKSAACMVSMDHAHTDACFVDVSPLSIVELFQSQGCKSCPPTVPKIHEASASNNNLLLLTYDVTYFDNQGWKDTFSSPLWDTRQRSYATAWERKGLFTPQVIVDGLPNDSVGADEKALGQIMVSTMEAKTKMTWNVMIEVVSESEVRILSDQPEVSPHDVVVVEYDSSRQVVKITAGPNKKTKLPHLNVVKSLTTIGEWNGGNVTIPVPVPSQMGDLKRVLLVQGRSGGPIVASMKLL